MRLCDDLDLTISVLRQRRSLCVPMLTALSAAPNVSFDVWCWTHSRTPELHALAQQNPDRAHLHSLNQLASQSRGAFAYLQNTHSVEFLGVRGGPPPPPPRSP